MPSPQLGVLVSEDDKIVEAIVNRINCNVRIRVKEPNIKISIGKESLKDEELMQNALTIYLKLLELLPKKNENIRNVKIKLTMGKPIVVEM
jgi:ribosomal protein L1